MQIYFGIMSSWSPNLVFLPWHQCSWFRMWHFFDCYEKTCKPAEICISLSFAACDSGVESICCTVQSNLSSALCTVLQWECVFLFLSQQIAVRSCCLWWPTSLNSTWKSRKSRRLAASCSVTSWRCFTGKMWWEAQLPEIMYYFPLGYTEVYQAYPVGNPERNTFWQLFVLIEKLPVDGLFSLLLLPYKAQMEHVL